MGFKKRKKKIFQDLKSVIVLNYCWLGLPILWHKLTLGKYIHLIFHSVSSITPSFCSWFVTVILLPWESNWSVDNKRGRYASMMSGENTISPIFCTQWTVVIFCVILVFYFTLSGNLPRYNRNNHYRYHTVLIVGFFGGMNVFQQQVKNPWVSQPSALGFL